MEHKLENFFREKIRSAESQPVNWNKPAAWQLIEMELAPQQKSRRYFYAAACALVILASAGLPIANQNSTVAPETEIAAHVIHPSENPGIEKECEDTRKPMIYHPEVIDLPKKYKQPDTAPDTKIVTDEPEVLLTEQTSESIPVQADVQEQVAVVQAVEPVIGVIIPRKEETTKVADKKVKLRLFRGPQKDAPESPETFERNLFARIN